MNETLHRTIVAAAIGTTLLVTRSVAEVAPKSPPVVRPFDVRQVTLLRGPFKNAELADAAYLLTLKPDRLLSWYRKEAGLEPKAEHYGGWEEMGIAGHSLGHYLSACARMAHASGDAEFCRRVDYVVAELAECLKSGGDGFVGAMPRGREVFAEIARGDIRSAGFDLNGSWVPWYTLHKLFAGLLDAHRLCDNPQALEVAEKLGRWAIATTKDLTPDQWQRMLACEHGGMNESLAELYELTGDKAFLELAKKFYHRAILDPLADERDELAGKHSNTQIPKIIGAAKLAELTGEARYATIARFFWSTMVAHHTYAMGGNSLGEHLGPPDKLNDRLGANTAETCNTYNMLKLTAALFAHDPDAKYAEYAERALWNHILASQNSQTGMVCYFVPLQAGATKPFMEPEAFTCCSGSGMENHARYGEYIYARSSDALYVEQFISSELRWDEAGIRVRQQSQLPDEGGTRLEFQCKTPRDFTLYIRRPAWSQSGFRFRVNGEDQPEQGSAGEFAAIRRTWKTGDVVEVEMPLTLRAESMPDNPKRAAFFMGPMMLVGLIDKQEGELLPVLVTGDRKPGEWLARTGGSPPRFTTVGAGRPRDLPVEPFFAVRNERYIAYWDLFTEDQWLARRREYEAEQKRQQELAARTVDLFAIGEMQAERDHAVQGEKTGPGDFGGRKFRHAWDGGWFSFDVGLPDDGPADLIVTYWGGETGARQFDVLLDGEKLATESLHQDRPGQFWDRVYHLPLAGPTDKNKASVRFQASPGNFAGGVFGVRVVRREESASP